MQQSFVVSKFDPSNWKDNCAVVERPIPSPKHNEVLVRVVLRPINVTDLSSIRTGWRGRIRAPAVPGSEVLYCGRCTFESDGCHPRR